MWHVQNNQWQTDRNFYFYQLNIKALNGLYPILGCENEINVTTIKRKAQKRLKKLVIVLF